MKKALVRSFYCLVFLACAAFIFPAVGNSYTERYNLTFLFNGTTANYIDYVDKAKGSLNVVCPDYMEINQDGTLRITQKTDPALVSEMHARGIKVTPFLANHWDRNLGRAALQNSEKIASEIAEAVKLYDFDGLNIDLENLNEDDRSDYVDFVRILKNTLPEGKIVSVSVSANPGGATKGWAGSYDYKALGELSDYLLIMAYDEHYSGGPQGPVASAAFVENSIKYAITKVPKNKILLGVPFYGRYWNDDTGMGGKGITTNDVERIVRDYDGKMDYDTSRQSAKADFTILSWYNKPVIWGGQVVREGNYTAYYENERSMKYKLSLVQKYDIKGTGSWCLGQENPGIWDYYSLWLKGKYYSDILNHWAQDSILKMEKKGWMVGTSEDIFSPDKVLTRAESAVMLVNALGLGDEAGGEPFSDIKGHWAADKISIARKYGIISGKGSDKFFPDDPVTRQEISVMLDKILVLPDPSQSGNNPENISFRDVSPIDNWAYTAIVDLQRSGIISGMPDHTFLPLKNVTRGEMAVMMTKASNYPFKK